MGAILTERARPRRTRPGLSLTLARHARGRGTSCCLGTRTLRRFRVNLRDRLRLLARQRAAADAEFAPFDPEAVVDLENRYEAPPQDRDGLFAIMMDRLEDIAFDLAHGDFTDRRTVQGIAEESEMQRTLARRLRENANGAYLVTREEEVADRKYPDIRLSTAVRGNQKAVVEVKIATITGRSRTLRRSAPGPVGRQVFARRGSARPVVFC